MSASREVNATRHETAVGATASATETLACEAPLELVVDGETLAVLLRTPTGSADDLALAAGFLLAEGIIDDRRDVHALAPCTDPAAGSPENRVLVTLAAGVTPPRQRRRFLAGASCGLCGVDQFDGLLGGLPSRPAVPAFDARIAAIAAAGDLAALVRPYQALFAATGGVHAAALFRFEGVHRPGGPELIDAREDIGRHNAVDKLIGHRLLADDLPAFDAFLWVSGRLSFELVQKALRAGLGGIVAVGAPSALAAELAGAHGLVLGGFARGTRVTFYGASP